MKRNEVSLKDFDVYSGKVDHISFDRSKFSTNGKFNENVINPDSGETKFEGIGVVEYLANNEKSGMCKFCFEDAMWYRRNLISVSNVVKNGHSFVHNKISYKIKIYKQKEGIEYFEAFSPTNKSETFRPFLALAAKEGFTFRPMVVKAASLHPRVDQEVYLE